MSIEKTHKMNFYEIILRLMELTGYTDEYKVAEILGFTRSAFSQRKARGSVPVDKIAIECELRGWNFDWVMYGKGSANLAPPTQADFPAIGDYQSLSDPVLNEIIEMLQTEPPETAQFILQLLKSRKSTREALKGLEKVGDGNRYISDSALTTKKPAATRDLQKAAQVSADYFARQIENFTPEEKNKIKGVLEDQLKKTSKDEPVFDSDGLRPTGTR